MLRAFQILSISTVLSSFGLAQEALEVDPLLFEVRYTPQGVVFAGVIDSEENALELAESVNSVRPDLKILNRGLRIDSEAEIPNLSDLKSLLAELGISTHNGSVRLTQHSLVIEGTTDSQITTTALRIRLDPLLEERTFIDRLCIVPSDDMPTPAVRLSSGEIQGPLINFDVNPEPTEIFEMPGISLSNLFPMILSLSDLSRLQGGSEAPHSSEPTTTDDPQASPTEPTSTQTLPLLKASPVATAEGASPDTAPAQPLPPIRAVPAPPEATFVELASIYYTRNSFLLQAGQESTIASVTNRLSKPPLAGHTVLVRAVKSAAQSATFGEYLAEKRGSAVKELLVNRGIPVGDISVELVSTQTSQDKGEVKVVVKIPPAPLEEETPSEEDSAATVAEARPSPSIRAAAAPNAE